MISNAFAIVALSISAAAGIRDASVEENKVMVVAISADQQGHMQLNAGPRSRAALGDTFDVDPFTRDVPLELHVRDDVYPCIFKGWSLGAFVDKKWHYVKDVHKGKTIFKGEEPYPVAVLDFEAGRKSDTKQLIKEGYKPVLRFKILVRAWDDNDDDDFEEWHRERMAGLTVQRKDASVASLVVSRASRESHYKQQKKPSSRSMQTNKPQHYEYYVDHYGVDRSEVTEYTVFVKMVDGLPLFKGFCSDGMPPGMADVVYDARRITGPPGKEASASIAEGPLNMEWAVYMERYATSTGGVLQFFSHKRGFITIHDESVWLWQWSRLSLGIYPGQVLSRTQERLNFRVDDENVYHWLVPQRSGWASADDGSVSQFEETVVSQYNAGRVPSHLAKLQAAHAFWDADANRPSLQSMIFYAVDPADV